MQSDCQNEKVTTLFFGGGTPSLMPPETVEAVIAAADRLWGIDSDAEITLEANPTSTEATRFLGFRAAGINRLSLGVQALDDAALQFLGREHCVSEALIAVQIAQAAFDRTSFDLIYARPEQTVAMWKAELTQALNYAGEHLSLYQLTIEPGTQFFHRHKAGAFILPDEMPAMDMYEVTQDVMDAAGRPAYEISNHARIGAQCRHNVSCWRGGEYIGIGPGAHGRYGRDGRRYATRARRSPEAWLTAVQKEGHGMEETVVLSPREQAEERVLTGLRLCEGVDKKWVEALAPKRLDALYDAGLLTANATHICATAKGRPLLNQLVRELVV